MSGGTDRREDEQVPQFYGRIDEKFAEWETDVRLWQVEFKVEDRAESVYGLRHGLGYHWRSF